jgi:uncharacterized protein (TIGR02145 family)
MRRIYTILGFIAVVISLNAQTPLKMTYQFTVRNTSGDLVRNTSVGVLVTILRSSPNGTIIYKETYDPVPKTNDNGLVTLNIGTGSASFGTFAVIDWSAAPYFLKTETDISGGTNYTISATSQIMSVPYTFYARSSKLTESLLKLSVSETGDTLSFGKTQIIIPGISESPVTDIDGNVYDTVKINNQIWMKENLKVTKFNDGMPIQLNPTFNGTEMWPYLFSAAYCWYNNDISNKDIYGALYNYWAVISPRLCPVGWHVPASEDYTDFAYQYRRTGSVELMETGSSHWINGTGTNTTHFTALPAGGRSSAGFGGLGTTTSFGITDGQMSGYGGMIKFFPVPTGVWGSTPSSTLTDARGAGVSVRCIKNN